MRVAIEAQEIQKGDLIDGQPVLDIDASEARISVSLPVGAETYAPAERVVVERKYEQRTDHGMA